MAANAEIAIAHVPYSSLNWIIAAFVKINAQIHPRAKMVHINPLIIRGPF